MSKRTEQIDSIEIEQSIQQRHNVKAAEYLRTIADMLERGQLDATVFCLNEPKQSESWSRGAPQNLYGLFSNLTLKLRHKAPLRERR